MLPFLSLVVSLSALGEVSCFNSPASSSSSPAPADANPITSAWRSLQQQPVQSRAPLQLALPQLSPAQQQQHLASPLNNETVLKQVQLMTIKHNQLMRNLTLQQPASPPPGRVRSQIEHNQVTSQDLQDEYQAHINSAGHEITKILRKFFQHGYDKRVRPNYSGPPALVNVSFHIISISSVSEVQMDFTTDFYFRQKWFDPRLEFKPVGQIQELCVGAEFADKIWLPDTFFANEKTATFHKATTENTFIRVGYNGRVYRSIRLTVTCSCPMDLQYFPMDRQRCKIEIESYGYSTSEIDYRWEKGNESVTLDGKIELPQFKVLGFKMGQELQSLSSGDYIRLYCEIHFVRALGFYLIQIYIPASLIVIISWVSFWLHRNATPARVTLGVTTVLTMTTLMSSTNSALPKISYIKSIDVFLGTCFVMVFASLLEYASVGYIGKRIAMKRKYLQDLQQMQQHHQKVCVAAAASAAAAAAAAQHANPVGVAAGLLSKQQKPNQTMSSAAKQLLVHMQHDHTLTRPTIGNRTNTPNKLMLQQMRHYALESDPVKHSPPEAAAAAQPNQAPVEAASNEPAASKTSTGDQAEPNVRICGLTPSDIDKYSRVVFPICFVCFCQMYWIIYGHISQQIDDHGPPLIPFVRS